MNTLILFLSLTLTNSFTAFDAPAPLPSKRDRPTKLAQFQMATYIASAGTELRLNIDKQLGGPVYLRLIDSKGKVYFDQTLGPFEATARLSLDITDLPDGDYLLKVSNGLVVEIRQITITAPKPNTPIRSITTL